MSKQIGRAIFSKIFCVFETNFKTIRGQIKIARDFSYDSLDDQLHLSSKELMSSTVST